ncbi:MAG TPA: glycosyltransferase family A protein [Actinopolymorphaceae bacterium]|nr:glycosyltransferase family A protein [Actinopolymorphaceae bacterium]
MSTAPRLSIGLPVYNGERYLAEALEALLGQSYTDYELIISDNASTDRTPEICRDYAARDERIRYVRQETNLGASGNHNFVFRQARGELFKWASHDDLYGRDLLSRCIDALDADPELVLAHAWQAIIDGDGNVVLPVEYPLNTDDPRAAERFRSLLMTVGGDDFYGVVRSEVLRRTALLASYHHADRTIVAELVLHGRFHQVPEMLYFRRDHADRAERATPTIKARSANLEPRRGTWRNPALRLLVEYVFGFVGVIQRSPLSSADRNRCYRHLGVWLVSRALPRSSRRMEDTVASMAPTSIPAAAAVPGRGSAA